MRTLGTGDDDDDDTGLITESRVCLAGTVSTRRQEHSGKAFQAPDAAEGIVMDEEQSDDGSFVCVDEMEAFGSVRGVDGGCLPAVERIPDQPEQVDEECVHGPGRAAEGGSLEKAMKSAREVQKEVRRKDPTLDARPRTSRDDPEFMRCKSLLV